MKINSGRRSRRKCWRATDSLAIMNLKLQRDRKTAKGPRMSPNHGRARKTSGFVRPQTRKITKKEYDCDSERTRLTFRLPQKNYRAYSNSLFRWQVLTLAILVSTPIPIAYNFFGHPPLNNLRQGIPDILFLNSFQCSKIGWRWQLLSTVSFQ